MRPDHLILVVAALCVLALVFRLGGRSAPSPPTPQRMIEAYQQRKTTDQRAWEKRLRTLINKRIFTKVERPGGVLQAWVGPEFYALDFVTQWAVVGEVHSHYAAQDPDVGAVLLYDSWSGENIGSFSTEAGLQMKDVE
jgi:hypothetical protein